MEILLLLGSVRQSQPPSRRGWGAGWHELFLRLLKRVVQMMRSSRMRQPRVYMRHSLAATLLPPPAPLGHRTWSGAVK